MAGKAKAPWRPPTRRMFVALLGTAAATFAIGERERQIPDPPPPRMWIGHHS